MPSISKSNQPVTQATAPSVIYKGASTTTTTEQATRQDGFSHLDASVKNVHKALQAAKYGFGVAFLGIGVGITMAMSGFALQYVILPIVVLGMAGNVILVKVALPAAYKSKDEQAEYDRLVEMQRKSS